jgi:hypothetical protein
VLEQQQRRWQTRDWWLQPWVLLRRPYSSLFVFSTKYRAIVDVNDEIDLLLSQLSYFRRFRVEGKKSCELCGWFDSGCWLWTWGEQDCRKGHLLLQVAILHPRSKPFWCLDWWVMMDWVCFFFVSASGLLPAQLTMKQLFLAIRSGVRRRKDWVSTIVELLNYPTPGILVTRSHGT